MIDRDYKNILKSTESPCQDCHSRELDYCKFYNKHLRLFHGEFEPCEECNEDYATALEDE